MASSNLSSLSCEELCSFLRDKKFPNDVIEAFKDQEIDGETFLELKDEEINGISKKLGIRKKLKQLQKPQTSKEDYIMVKYNEKNYCLSNVPSNKDYIVQQAEKEIEGQLKLDHLGQDLSTLGRFVRIAHFGLIGHPDLQIKVRTSLRSVFELCHDTAHTLQDFQRTSQEALESLQTAYRYLEEALEDQALEILINLQEMSNKMKTQAGTLSKKCSEQSQFIKEVGDTTLIKRSEVKKEQEDTQNKMESLEVEKVEADEDIKEAETTKQEAQTDLQSTYTKKEEAMDKLISASEENQKEYQKFMDEMHKKREALTSEYKKEIAKVDEDYTRSKGENQTTYFEQKKANDDKFKVSSLTITKEYEEALQENEDDLPKKLEDNENWLSDEQNKIKKKYQEAIDIDCKDSNESIRKIENDYSNEIREIEQASRDELRKNEEMMNAQLKQNKEILDTSLSGNERVCKAQKDGTWFFQSGARAEYESSKATKDAGAKHKRAEGDKDARDNKIEKDDKAKSRESDKKRDAYNSKEKKLQPHRDKIQSITTEALRNQNKDINKAIAKKDKLDLDARNEKKKADIRAKDQRDKKILKAEKDRQTANDNALKEKNKSNEEAKSTKENAAKKREENYKDRLQQLDKDEESFKAGMKTTLDSYETKINDIKQKEQKNQKLIDESKKTKKMAQKQMRKVVEQLTQCKSRAEIHKVTEESLKEAVQALNEIEAIMINVGYFWKEVEGMCESVTGRTMKTQVKMLSDKNPQERKAIWQSQAFKMDALNFYGKWIALKGVCATASGKVNSALDEVRHYMVENPNEDEAFKSIQEMAGNFLKELPHEESS